MSFQDDLDADRAAIFVDASGAGFAESITHTAVATGVETVVNCVAEEQLFSILDPDQITRLHVSAGALATIRAGDLVSQGGFTWGVVNVRTLEGMHEVSLRRQDVRQ